MPAFGVLVNMGRRYGMGGSKIGLIILKVSAFTLYNSRNGWLVTFLLFSLKNVILSYSGRAQKFWASYQKEFWRRKFNFLRTLSKKHCGRKDNLGRVFAKFNFSESRAGTVSSLISIGLLEKVVLVKIKVFKGLPCKVHQAQDLLHRRQFFLHLAIVWQSTQQRSLSCSN